MRCGIPIQGIHQASESMHTTASRRRSQRLLLQVRVVLEGKLANKSPYTEETQTIVVNAHGALVELSASLDHGQIIVLRNVKTSEKIECSVKLVTPTGNGKFNTAIEFTKPNPGFWHISFPPEDWSLRNPEAKRSG
jgi:hypothetical protein